MYLFFKDVSLVVLDDKVKIQIKFYISQTCIFVASNNSHLCKSLRFCQLNELAGSRAEMNKK